MDAAEKLEIAKKAIDCCFVKSACFPCPFYNAPCHGKPGRCMGMKNAGKLLISYLDEIEKEVKHGKDE